MDPPNPPPASRSKISHEPISAILYDWPSSADRDRFLRGWESELTGLGRPTQILLAAAEAGGSGVGAVLRDRILEARHPLVWIAPLASPPGELKPFLRAIDAVDVVVGCRTRPKSTTLRAAAWWYRWSMAVLFGVDLVAPPAWPGWTAWRRSVGYWLLFGLRFHDPEAGVQLWRRDVLRMLPIQSDGSFVFVELLAKGNVANALMDEVVIGQDSGCRAGQMPADFRRVVTAPALRISAKEEVAQTSPS